MKTLDVLERVLKAKRIKDATRKHYIQAFQSLAKYTDEFPVSGIVIDEWTASIEGLADITIGLYFDKVRAAGKYMERISGKNQYGVSNMPNPTNEATRPRVLKKDRRYYQAETLMAIVSACHFGYDRELVLTFIDSGCRAVDLANLKGKNIYEDTFSVEGKTGKSTYRLDARLCQALKKLAGSDDAYVFISGQSGQSRWETGQRMSPGGLSMRIRRICERAGLSGEKLGSHTLRHSVGSLVSDETLSPIAVKAILQQKTIKTAMIYIHDAEEKVQRQLSPLQLMTDRAFNGHNGDNGVDKQEAFDVMAIPENAEGVSSTAVTIKEPELEGISGTAVYYDDMFPEILDDMEIRPLLKSDDLKLMRLAFIAMARTENYHMEMLKARELMKRILRKASGKVVNGV